MAPSLPRPPPQRRAIAFLHRLFQVERVSLGQVQFYSRKHRGRRLGRRGGKYAHTSQLQILLSREESLWLDLPTPPAGRAPFLVDTVHCVPLWVVLVSVSVVAA